MQSVADAHVDVLWKLDESASADFFRDDCGSLQASYANLVAGEVRTQVFALFTSDLQDEDVQLQKVSRMIDLFDTRVALPGKVRSIRNQSDFAEARRRSEIGGLLSLEGAGCIGTDLDRIVYLHDRGVAGIGLTWNHENDLAYGCRSSIGTGLTQLGREAVQMMSRLHMWVDIAHLSYKGIEDVFSIADGGVMASHANVYAVQPHPRNLPDEYIVELIRRQGWLGLTFEGSFVSDPRAVTVDDVLRHLNHVLALGGEHHVGFGSDFDGTSNFIPGLTSAADYQAFGRVLRRRYGEELARRLLFENFQSFLFRSLPDGPDENRG